MTDTAVAGAAAGPGATFDYPGVPSQTQWFDQYEDTQSLSFTLSQSNQLPILGIADLRRTDVVFDWRFHFTFTQTFTAGTGQTLTSSAYAPYNFIGPSKLNIQNQYAALDVESGIDWYIFELISPYRRGLHPTNNYASPEGKRQGDTNGPGYLNTNTPQANLVNSAQWTNAVAGFDLILDMEAGLWFDEYWPLDIGGNLVGPPSRQFVSPQYLAGVTRLIKPQIFVNPLFGATTDLGPVFTTTLTPTSDTASTASGTTVLSIRRFGVYGNNNPNALPPVQPWQFRKKTTRLSINGVTTKALPVPDDTGQLLFVYLRMFDPLAAGGLGAPIAPSALSNVQMQYGSGLFWFNGTPEEAQSVWLDQHGFLLPQGVIAFDFSILEDGRISNRRALNTLTTAGVQLFLTFSSATSASAYAVIGTGSLVYVT